jgi:hypothetical protein
MIEKVKGWVIYIVTPFAFMAGIIWFLLTKNTTLKDQLNREKASRELGNTLENLERQKEKADDAEAKFDSGLADLKRALSDDEQS